MIECVLIYCAASQTVDGVLKNSSATFSLLHTVFHSLYSGLSGSELPGMVLRGGVLGHDKEGQFCRAELLRCYITIFFLPHGKKGTS